MKAQDCSYCNCTFPISLDRCPHCGQPGLFPNVKLAELADEINALDNRFRDAIQEAQTRRCDAVLKDYKKVVSDKSKAVISRPLTETLRLATGDNELYSTYYKLTEAEVRIPKGSKWDDIRPVYEGIIFPQFKEHIRFGSLTLSCEGLKNYGECSWVLKEDLVRHRTSVFEENCVMFCKKNVNSPEPNSVPKGYRATWQDRGKLAAAKASDEIQPDTPEDAYPEILLKEDPDPKDDKFVEAHTYGPLTIRTIERIVLKKPKTTKSKVFASALAKELATYDVKLETV